MKQVFLLVAFLILTFKSLFAQAPVLGTYPSTIIATASGNASVIPSVAPANTTSITAYTSTSFKGLLQVNPTTGILTITNAHPAGTYTILLTAFNGVSSITATCILTVNTNLCSQGLFSGTAQMPVESTPSAVAIADFDRDGKQDLVTTNAATDNISIRFGNGVGDFAGTTTLATGDQPTDVAIGDVNGDGFQDIAVTNFLSKTVSIRLGSGSGAFSDSTNFSVPGYPQAIVIADFNDDGRPDIAVANNTTNTVSIRLGNGQGSFSGTTEISVGNSPVKIIAADFNEDGKPDFATANSNSTLTIVRLGDGMGNFTATADLVAYPASSLALGDFNGDGHQDVALSSLQGNRISIRLGTGTGYFTSVPDIALQTYSSHIAIGDFNGDGKQDIATVNNSANVLTIYAGDGTGGFNWTGRATFTISPGCMAVGDFNNDGRQDLAVGCNNSTVAIRTGNTNKITVKGNNTIIANGDSTPDSADSTDLGNGGIVTRSYTVQNNGAVNLSISDITVNSTSYMFFWEGIYLPGTILPGAAATFTITFAPTSAGLKMATVNILSDNCDEPIYDFAIQGTGVIPTLGAYADTSIIATGAVTSITPVTIPINTTSITAFSTPNFKGLLHVNPVTGKLTVTNAHPAGTYQVIVKAFNGRLTTTTSLYVKVTNPPCSQGSFTETTQVYTGSISVFVAIGDFNGDGRQDLATADWWGNNVSIRLGDGAGGFTTAANVNVGYNPGSLAIGDFNGDGKQDLIITHVSSNNICIRLGDGTGGFTEMPDVVLQFPSTDIVVGDFNSDGKADFAVCNYQLYIWYGDGAGGFYLASILPANPFTIVTGDFNNDGRLDLAMANANAVSILLQNAAGDFSILPVGFGLSPSDIAVSDFNGDGKQDLAVANYNSNNISIFLGNGLGNFTGNVTVPTYPYSRSLVAGDFNGDGKPDLAIAGGSNNFFILLGNGAGNFSRQDDTPLTVDRPEQLATGDFNSDGRLDIALLGYAESTVVICLGNANEISVQGNNMLIADGDTIPATINHTDFGTITSGSNLVRTFTIQNTGTGVLIITNITINGTDSAAFIRSGINFPVSLVADSSKTFTISFSPTSIGVKNARVHINNNDCDESVFDFAIKGTASCVLSGPDNVWLGNSANWNTATNWSLNFIPSECTKVVVNSGVPFMPEITSPASTCYSLTLNNGATMTVKSGGHLNITANN